MTTNQDQTQLLRRALRANGIQVLDEQNVEPSLEDVFLDMVQPTVAHA